MFIPKEIVNWITSVKLDEAPKLREENAALRAERDSIKDQLRVAQINSDWLRMQLNAAQVERTAFMEKAYGVKVPVPEIARQPSPDPTFNVKDFGFDDLGDDVAKTLGLPVYSTKQ